MITQITKQRKRADMLLEMWNAYISVPVGVEQMMTWLDDFPPNIIAHGIKQAARKIAMVRGNISSEHLLAYTTRVMQNALEQAITQGIYERRESALGAVRQ